jgi:hypothetical protein
MADTVTDLQTLNSRPEDMKTMMELMIMNIQVNNYKCILYYTSIINILLLLNVHFLGRILSST